MAKVNVKIKKRISISTVRRKNASVKKSVRGDKFRITNEITPETDRIIPPPKKEKSKV